MQRPHLTLNNKLMGTGEFAEPPARKTREYKRGYLCGVIRGDAPSRRRTSTPARTDGLERGNHFRLAPVDFEALARAQVYLHELELDTTHFSLRGRARVVPRDARDSCALASLGRRPSGDHRLARPNLPLDWYKGFLAGIFDAEGLVRRRSDPHLPTRPDDPRLDHVRDADVSDMPFVVEKTGPRGSGTCASAEASSSSCASTT